MIVVRSRWIVVLRILQIHDLDTGLRLVCDFRAADGDRSLRELAFILESARRVDLIRVVLVLVVGFLCLRGADQEARGQ